MPLQFPVSPSIGQIFDIGGKAYVWNGSSWTAWTPSTGNSGLVVTDKNGDIVPNASQINLMAASLTTSGSIANTLFTGSGPELIGTYTSGGQANFNISAGFNSVLIHCNQVFNTSGAGGHCFILWMNNDLGSNYYYHGRNGLASSSGDNLFNADGSNSGTAPEESFMGQAFFMAGLLNGGSAGQHNGSIFLSNLQNQNGLGPTISWEIDWSDFNFGIETWSSGGGHYSSVSPISLIYIASIQGGHIGTISGNISAWGWPAE